MQLSRRAMMGAMLVVGGCASGAPIAPALTLAAGLKPLERLLGRWAGEGSGEPGISRVERSYTSVLGGNFIEVRNRSTYAPQAANPKGETHEDVGYWSYDRGRKLLVLRQFHLEGFANTYSGVFAEPLVMTSESIENIGAGFTARETYRFLPGGELEEVFEIAPPGGAFSLYSRNVMKRAG